MRWIHLVAVSVLLTLTVAAVAQEGAPETPAADAAPPATVADPAAAADAFFATQLDEEGWRDAVGTLVAGTLVERTTPQAADRLIEGMAAVRQALGVPGGFERLADEAHGERIRRLTYLVHYGEKPLFWELFFYRPPGEEGWSLLNAQYDSFTRLRDEG